MDDVEKLNIDSIIARLLEGMFRILAKKMNFTPRSNRIFGFLIILESKKVFWEQIFLIFSD